MVDRPEVLPNDELPVGIRLRALTFPWRTASSRPPFVSWPSSHVPFQICERKGCQEGLTVWWKICGEPLVP